MKVFLLLGTVLSVVISYMSFVFYKAFDWDKGLDLFNYETCKIVSDFPGVEDLTMFHDVAIGITSDFLELYERSNLDVANGGLVVIDPAKQTVAALEIQGFPQDIAFHPHGIFIFEQRLLYVINHAYKYGGERVEVFQLTQSPITVTYLRSIQFPDSTAGTLNDLVVIAEDELYVTQYWAIAHDVNKGMEHGTLAHMRMIFTHYFLNTAGIHFCTNNNGQANCKWSVDKSGSFNGITTDGTDIFAIDIVKKHVRRYAIGADKGLTEIERISTIRSIDNIEYDANTGNFYLGSVGSLKHLHFIDPSILEGDNWTRESVHWPGGAVEIYPENGSYKSRELLLMNGYFGLSAAVRAGDVVMLGSWFDKGVGFCKPKF